MQFDWRIHYHVILRVVTRGIHAPRPCGAALCAVQYCNPAILSQNLVGTGAEPREILRLRSATRRMTKWGRSATRRMTKWGRFAPRRMTKWGRFATRRMTLGISGGIPCHTAKSNTK